MKIIMTLKSDAIPGSGNSLAGIIDRDINYDKYGLPFIPAKRIKGILRESAEDLGIDENDLFGVEGSPEGSSFIIDNGYVKNYESYKKFLSSKVNKDFLSQQATLDYFTYTRSQTTIENGVAKENSLRVSRVLKKGLVFEFNLEYNKKDEENIEKICKVTRGFGASRTRGFGEIELRLLTENETTNSSEIAKPELNKNNEKAKIKLTVENKEQLLISSKPGMSQISEDYITGSTVLGALASNYIKYKGVDDKFNELFLSGKISFGNLYPSDVKKGLFYPSALSVKKVKTDKNEIANAEYYDHIILDYKDKEDNEILKNIVFKGGFSDFVSQDNSKKANLIKNTEAHHRRDSNRHIAKSTKEGSGDFFQFEVIEPNQIFTGEIIGEKSLLEELLYYFPENGILRLGKSKTGQYGKCSFKLDEIKSIKSELEWGNGESIKIILRSDMILINDLGFATPNVNLFVKELASKFNINHKNLKIVKQFSKTTDTGGFMGVWKMPRIQKPALKAGTVLEIENNSDKDIDIKNIESIFFGDRIEDGFGIIAIYENEEAELNTPENNEIKAKTYKFNDNLIDDLIKYQIKKIVKNELQVTAVDNDEKIKGINSFIGKLIGFLNDSESFDSFNGKLRGLDSDIQKRNLKKFKNMILKNENKKNPLCLELISIRDPETNKNKKVYSINPDLADENNSLLNLKNLVNQKQNNIPDEIKNEERYRLEYNFELYKHYALAYLTQIKYLNRG